MNLEAFAVVGVVILVFGLVLLVPGYFLGKWLNRKAPSESQGRMRVTAAGFLVYGLMVVALMVGFSMQYLAPESFLGRLTSTSSGRFQFAMALIILWVPIELICKKTGIALMRKNDSETRSSSVL